MFLDSLEDYCPECEDLLNEDGTCPNGCITPEDDDFEVLSDPRLRSADDFTFYDDDLEDVIPGLDFVDEDDFQE